MGEQAPPESIIAKIFGHKEMKTMKFYKSILFEFVYTFYLLFCVFCIFSVPSAIFPDSVHIAFSFGLLLSAVYFQASKFFDCHLNPAVTFGMICCGETPIIRGFCCIIMQACGAVLAGVRFYHVDKENTNACCLLTDEVNLYSGFFLEFITTHIFVYVARYVHVKERRNKELILSSMFYGLTFVAGYLITVSSTSGGINPARCLGPALWLNCWTNHWLYWAAPLLGGLTGAWVCTFSDRQEMEENKQQ